MIVFSKDWLSIICSWRLPRAVVVDGIVVLLFASYPYGMALCHSLSLSLLKLGRLHNPFHLPGTERGCTLKI